MEDEEDATRTNGNSPALNQVVKSISAARKFSTPLLLFIGGGGAGAAA
jgi:hypothetical protein